MREISFRAFVKDKQKIYDIKKIDFNYCMVWFDEENNDTDTIRMFDQVELMQCTGLKDKNGKKIFEGDIVKFTDYPFGNSIIGVVCVYKGSFCIKYKYSIGDAFHQIGKTDRWEDMGASCIIIYEYEIIGNIHDNSKSENEILTEKTISYTAMINSRHLDRIEELENRLVNIRKETAKEILELLVPDCKRCDENWHNGCLCLQATLAEKIAKKYGIEIGEENEG